MKRELATAAVCILLLGTMSACGAQTAGPEAAGTSPSPSETVPQEQSTPPPPGTPQINWDHVLYNAKQSSVATAAKDGELPFAPILPPNVAPVRVEVTDPATVTDPALRGVAYYFDVAGMGRIALTEVAASPGDADLGAIAASHSASGQYEVRRISNVDVLLISGGGVGRARAVVRGVVLDMTGPMISPDQVADFAQRLIQGN